MPTLQPATFLVVAVFFFNPSHPRQDTLTSLFLMSMLHNAVPCCTDVEIRSDRRTLIRRALLMEDISIYV